MRRIVLAAAVCVGCATGAPGEGPDASRETSVAYFGPGGGEVSRVIRVQAGPVRVRHSIPSTARLRATTLEGLDPGNRHLRYVWDTDGTFEVGVSGRYRHAVTGSILGGGTQRVRSTLTYTALPDSTGPGPGGGPVTDEPGVGPGVATVAVATMETGAVPARGASCATVRNGRSSTAPARSTTRCGPCSTGSRDPASGSPARRRLLILAAWCGAARGEPPRPRPLPLDRRAFADHVPGAQHGEPRPLRHQGGPVLASRDPSAVEPASRPDR